MDTNHEESREIIEHSHDRQELEQEYVRASLPASVLEKVIMSGDLSELTPPERLLYYKAVCDSVGLNPFTKPFDYMELSGEGGNKVLKLYPNKTCAEQLRERDGIEITDKRSEVIEGIYLVHVKGKNKEGRTDEATGAVPLVEEDGEWKTASSGKRYLQKNGQLKPLPPLEKANAMMKAETKAKRRMTLSLAGLGLNPLHRAIAVDIEDLPSTLALVSQPQGQLPPPQHHGQTKPMGLLEYAESIGLSRNDPLDYIKVRFEKSALKDLDPDQKAILKEELERGVVSAWVAEQRGDAA